jgi:hypothetical protein
VLIVPGGGIAPSNAALFALCGVCVDARSHTKAVEIHGSARVAVDSKMVTKHLIFPTDAQEYRNPLVAMGAASNEYAWMQTSSLVVEEILKAFRSACNSEMTWCWKWQMKSWFKEDKKK